MEKNVTEEATNVAEVTEEDMAEDWTAIVMIMKVIIIQF